MKRSLLLSLCAVAIVAMSLGQAMATISLSLNLRYTYPGITSLGGAWDLKATTDNVNGLSGLAVVLDNITFGSATLNPAIDGIPIETRASGTITEFVWGYDPAAAAGAGKFADVGNGAGTPGNVADDDIYLSPYAGANATTYDNMALIASGTFGAVRPSFATFPGVGGGPTAGQNWTSAAMTAGGALDTIVFMGGDGVRGDSVAVDGLLAGDVDRNGTVDTNDLIPVLNNFFGPVVGWDAGDVALNDGTADTNDLIDVLNNFFASAAAPAITDVPEPASFALLAAAGMMLGFIRKR